MVSFQDELVRQIGAKKTDRVQWSLKSLSMTGPKNDTPLFSGEATVTSVDDSGSRCARFGVEVLFNLGNDRLELQRFTVKPAP